MAKAQRWCFTLNNYNDSEFKVIQAEFEKLKPSYCVIGKEIGKGGTPHLQGYVNLGRKGRKSLSLMKKLLPRAHLEVAKGSDADSEKYCTKEDKDAFVIGTPQAQGKRNDLSAAIETLKETKKIKDVALNHSESFVKYHRGFEALQQVLTADEPRDFKTKLYVLVGKPGTGKSRWANAMADKLGSTYYKPRGEWWDGYEGQDSVIIDDFYGWLKYDELLKITDRYPYRVPIKGGYRQFVSKQIFITSNTDPDSWYKFAGYESSALRRRIDYNYVDTVPPLPVDDVQLAINLCDGVDFDDLDIMVSATPGPAAQDPATNSPAANTSPIVRQDDGTYVWRGPTFETDYSEFEDAQPWWTQPGY